MQEATSKVEQLENASRVACQLQPLPWADFNAMALQMQHLAALFTPQLVARTAGAAKPEENKGHKRGGQKSAKPKAKKFRMRCKTGFTESMLASGASDFSDDFVLGESASSDGENLPDAHPPRQAEENVAETDCFDAVSSGGGLDGGSVVGGASASTSGRPAFGQEGVQALQQFLRTWVALALFLPTQPGPSGAMADLVLHNPAAPPVSATGAETPRAAEAPQQTMEVDASGAPAVAAQTAQQE